MAHRKQGKTITTALLPLTKAALNEQIAQALGWTGFHRWSAAPGKRFGLPPGATHIGRNHEHSAEVPDYAADLNATVAALPEHVGLKVWRDQGYGRAMIDTPESGIVAFTHGDTPAEAAARALLSLLTDAAYLGDEHE